MAHISYTDRQIEVANLLRASSGEELSAEITDEIINMVGEAEQKVGDSGAPVEDTDTLIRLKLLTETDWRKKASLSALLISKSIEY
jgi:hypothetical protein